MADVSASEKPSALSEIFKPFLWILKGLGILLFLAVVGIVIFLVARSFILQKETGQLASTVTHAKVAGEEALNPIQRLARRLPPKYAYLLDPASFNPYAIESEVEVSADNKELGVKIVKFGLQGDRTFLPAGQDIILNGEIAAGGFKENEYDLEVYCSLEGYKNGELVPGRLLGADVIGNKGTVYAGTSRSFISECKFPPVQVTKQITAQEAKFVVVYNFITRSYMRPWFLNKVALADLNRRGLNPFNVYQVEDPLLSSNRIAKSKQTPGPMNLAINVPFQQPFTSGAEYQLLIQLSRSIQQGNLQTLERLTLKLPNVEDLVIATKGEKGFNLASGACDFEFVGQTEEGYNEYELSASKLIETNRNCEKKTLKELAISESECISIFKEPLFTCNFIPTKVPDEGLQSDTFVAEGKYTVKVEKKNVFDIRGQLVA